MSSWNVLHGMSYHFKANLQPSHQITTSTQEDRHVSPVLASPLIHRAFATQVKTFPSQSFCFFSRGARTSQCCGQTAASCQLCCCKAQAKLPSLLSFKKSFFFLIFLWHTLSFLKSFFNFLTGLIL